MRRVLISLGVVVVVTVALIIALPFIQARRLVTRFKEDLAALRSRELPLVSLEEHPLHENAFECQRALVVTNDDALAPFRLLSKGVDLQPWVHSEAPIETLPREVQEKLVAVGPLAEGLRSCSSSRVLRVIDGFAPWEGDFSLKVVSPLMRATVLETRVDLAAGAPERALSRCEQSYAVLFDDSHHSLISALLGSSLGDLLRRPCAQAMASVDPRVRRAHAATWRRLMPRFVAPPELLETERLNMSVVYFLPLAGEPQPTADSMWEYTDEQDPLPLVALHHYVALSGWSGWDARMRRLVGGDMTSARTVSSPLQLFIPDDWRTEVSDYSRFLQRIDEFQRRFALLPWLADGARGTPPFGARVDGGVEWPSLDGGVEFFPIPAP